MDLQLLVGSALLGVLSWLCLSIIKNTVAIGQLTEGLKQLHHRLDVVNEIEKDISSIKGHLRYKESNGRIY